LDGIPNEATSIAAINERIQGVEYVLLDEVSMVSCEDLQTLASQAAMAQNIHDVEFGGLNLILAGDFAQLPPVSGRALYDS
jgi:ATP-dependent DNA helicase PIF1